MVLLEIYPAPIELLNKLLSLLGDPEYIEVGVLGKCSDITLLSGVSGERCVTGCLLKMSSDRVLELYRESLYEKSAEEAEPMRGGVVDLRIVWRFSSFSVEFDGFKLKASGYGDVERLCTLLRLFKDYSLSAEVDVGRI